VGDENLSSVVSANGFAAGGWLEGSVAVQLDRLFFLFLNLEDGTDRLSRNVVKKLPLLCIPTQNSAVPGASRRKTESHSANVGLPTRCYGLVLL